MSCPLAIGANSIASTCLALKQPVASRSVFYQCTEQWRHCLKFRRKSTHSVCGVCDKLKAEMRHCGSFLEHARAADRLLQHLTMTWKSREQYWHARSLSQAKQELLCVIIDGYDRSKPLLPRWTQGRAPKGGAFESWLDNWGAKTCADRKKCHIAVFIQLLNNQSSVRL